jgi:hypothetical protein
MGRSVEAPPRLSKRSSKASSRPTDQRCFATGVLASHTRLEPAEADDRSVRLPLTSRYTWVLEHDTLVQQYVH